MINKIKNWLLILSVTLLAGALGAGSAMAAGKDLSYGNGCATGVKACFGNNQIIKDLNTIVEFLAGLVGLVVVAMIIAGGVQFSASRNNPEAVKAAKGRITNALLAFLVFMIMWGFLQWLIPGGVFG